MITYSKVTIPTSHNIKIKPKEFKEIVKGKKSFIIVENSRDFKVGQEILLKEHSGKSFTTQEVPGRINYITQENIEDGYILLGFRKWTIRMKKRDFGAADDS